MAGRHEERAALVAHPMAVADTSGLTNVHRIALTGASQSITLPALWTGRFCRLTVDSTADVQYAFSAGAAATIVLDQISVVGTGHASAGSSIFAGGAKDAKIRLGATHLNFISSAAAGFLEIEISECPA